ncbi:MAG: hypothetical protein MUO29_10455, partial [Desulfobacterales bacterium]|nr:hypothetical protein [Desulfobacterales bacterium]
MGKKNHVIDKRKFSDENKARGHGRGWRQDPQGLSHKTERFYYFTERRIFMLAKKMLFVPVVFFL